MYKHSPFFCFFFITTTTSNRFCTVPLSYVVLYKEKSIRSMRRTGTKLDRILEFFSLTERAKHMKEKNKEATLNINVTCTFPCTYNISLCIYIFDIYIFSLYCIVFCYITFYYIQLGLVAILLEHGTSLHILLSSFVL